MNDSIIVYRCNPLEKAFWEGEFLGVPLVIWIAGFAVLTVCLVYSWQWISKKFNHWCDNQPW